MKDIARRTLQLAAVAVALALLPATAAAQNDMSRFVTRSGDKLMEGPNEYRFVSINIPNLHLVEDNMRFEATNEWRFPDEFEIEDALTAVKQMGGRVARTYVLSVCPKDGPSPIPCHVRRPGEFNEEAFRALDKVLEVANRVGVRLIVPVVDNWRWWGGIESYAAHRGKPAEAFWTDPQLLEDYKKTVAFLINRRNTYTGRLYKDDRAILAWETGNELYAPYAWTKQAAAYIKSLDTNHLVLDGYYIGNRPVLPEALADPNIDVVSSHHYPNDDKTPGAMAADIARFHDLIKGKKPYIVGEFGFVPIAEAEKVLDTVISRGISGAMTWSLRYRAREGGFYWHSEPSGGGLYKAYHYPGFATGAAYEEAAMLRLLRAKAHAIRAIAPPPDSAPAAPVLLPVASPGAISWRGSVGATGYDLERAPAPGGPWTVVGAGVDETRVQYRPLFADETAEPGRCYHYRVRAKGPGGASAFSNVVGPVCAGARHVVDELEDFSRTSGHAGKVSLATADARQYKEDAHRLAGEAGGWVTYAATNGLESAVVDLFSDGAERPIEVSASADGTTFAPVEAVVRRYPTAVNLYGYKLPVRYEIAKVPAGATVLRIAFTAPAQIGRVELRHRK